MFAFQKCLIKCKQIYINKRILSYLKKPPLKIMFFGSDEFSLISLKRLNEEYQNKKLINNLEVVTSIKVNENAVHLFAKENNLKLHRWPILIKDKIFDLGIVVSFGHLIPNDVIKTFNLGMINIHASLLPRWRGAAPIIHAIINGDQKTGVTVMKIQPKKFDVGEIIAQQEFKIPADVLMPQLYTELAHLGANLLISCLKEIPYSLFKATPQPTHGITYAPKVNPNMTKVNWNSMTATQVFALYRAFYSLYPLTTTWKDSPIKLSKFELLLEDFIDNAVPGTIRYHKQLRKILIKCSDKWISCDSIKLLGKKTMSALDFNNGFLLKESVAERIFK